MGRFFNMDNKFFVFMGKIADLCMLNLLCIICCIPIVTAGASLTALYYVTMKMVRNEEAYIFRSFFRSFKQNFKQATVINIIMLASRSSSLYRYQYCRKDGAARRKDSGNDLGIYPFVCDDPFIRVSASCKVL